MLKRVISLLLGNGASVNIDGRDYGGRNVVIENNQVWIDGVKQDGELVGDVHITVTGNVERIEGSSTTVEVGGSCGHVKTMSGDVRCGDVTGDVGTMSGDVTCGQVRGSIKSMSGDIRTGARHD